MRDMFGEWNWDDAAAESSSVVGRREGGGSYEALGIEARLTFSQFAVQEMAPGATLEVGCGKGQWLQLLQARSGTAIGGDRSFRMLRRARSVTDVVQFDAARLPFPDRAFPNVLTVTVLQHLPEPRSAIAEMTRVARDRIVIYEMTWSPVPGQLTRGTSARSQSWYTRAFAARDWALRAVRTTRRPPLAVAFQSGLGGRSAILSLPRSFGVLLALHTWLVFEPRGA